MSMIADGHDIICDCNSPFGHLLASIFPPGHQDRFLSIEEIINRDIQQCLSGGTAEKSHGLPGGKDGDHIKQEDGDADVEDLILAAAAAAADEGPR